MYSGQTIAVTGSGRMGVDIQPRELLGICLAENEHRVAGYDRRLLRPAIVPFFTKLACRLARSRC